MKKIIMLYGLFIALISTFLMYQGCSELDNSATMAPDLDIHADGWAIPNSNNFHGTYIASRKWNLNECKTCHGGDYSGGTSGTSCLGCHSGSGGPQNCRLCHGNSEHSNPPKALNGDTLTTSLGVGIHMGHRFSTFSASVTCEECHTDFNGFDDPIHIGPDADGIAEINFGPLSRTVIGNITPNPTWDRNSASCSNTYCHGTFRDGNVNAVGIWTDEESVVCGSCHGDPVTGNPTPRTNGVFSPPHFSYMTINTCYICHETVINPQGQFINTDLHVNGVIDN